MWKGRIQSQANWIIDGAHNEAGFSALHHFLTSLIFEKVPFIFALKKDKDLKNPARKHGNIPL